MSASLIDERDINDLRQATSKVSRLATRIIIPMFIGLFVVVGAINVHFCSRFAELCDLSTMEVIQDWFRGVDPASHYSGKHLMAPQCWVTGLVQFSAAVILALVRVRTRRRTDRDARILRFIEKKCGDVTV